MSAIHNTVLCNYRMNKFLLKLVCTNKHVQTAVLTFAKYGEKAVKTLARGSNAFNALLF